MEAASAAQQAACAMPTAEVEAPQGTLSLIDIFFPGFSVFAGAFHKYLGIDLNLYIPLVLLFGGLTFAWRYFSEYFWNVVESHLMSSVEIRHDDEIYNILMAWVAAQRFAQGARRFVVNTNLNSRSWFLWRWDSDDDEEEETPDNANDAAQRKKALSYTPSFGSHTFWHKGHLLLFKRSQNTQQGSYLVVSEREEISISCFGRNPWILKELLLDARAQYLKKDEQKTLIYRGTTKTASVEPTWQRCMSRTSRPFSTVILNEKLKKDLIDDVTDYLNPATRRWYSNRGIPYRRGYLLYGPPGTGKSSLSLALAGFFKMRIYIVSLSSVSASEENLGSLFAELPRRCVVLLEDIDTAGLTHTRDDTKPASTGGSDDMVPGQVTTGTSSPPPSGRLSLSGLLNILDGVASQEGRVLIMTTNHLEKLDKALIRPGRVDMIVKFDNADQEMTSAIFRAIFATLEGDEKEDPLAPKEIAPLSPEEEKARADEKARKKLVEEARIDGLAKEFAAKIPTHEFSPAEIQGFLLKNKRSPETVVATAEQWVIDTRKEKKEKEIKDAEEKREAEKKKKEEEEKTKKEEAEAKKKEEEEKEKEKEKEKKSKKKSKKSKKSKKDDSDSSGSDSDSEAEKETESKKEAKAAKEAEVKKDTDAKKEVKAPEEVELVAKLTELAVPKEKEDGKHGADSGYGTP